MSRTGRTASGKAAKAAPAKRKAVAKVPRKSAKELRQERFVAEYLVDYNGRRAAVAAGFSPENARSIASQLLKQDDVQAMIQERQSKLCDQLEDMERFVLSRLMGVATADARELVELHRVACRYCWGKKHRYQRTQNERDEAYASWLENEQAKQDMDPAGKPTRFDELGGVGYTPKKDPNPKCPECFGDGEARSVFNDTRDLSQSGRLLYAGVEETQHGMKMKMHSQMDATLNIGKHFGMFATKIVGGKGGDKQPGATDVIGDILDLVNASDTGVGPARSRRPGG